jgi:hypothetical protein
MRGALKQSPPEDEFPPRFFLRVDFCADPLSFAQKC